MSRHVGMGKHWCEYCRTWIQPDQQSIRLHNQGQRHKQAERDFLYQQRKERQDEKHAKAELAKTLQEIEAAAAEAVARDLAPKGASSAVATGAAPAAADRASRWGQNSDHRGAAEAGAGGSDGAGQGRGPPPPPPPAPEEDLGDGLYEVRGMVYLMGEHAEARPRLVAGRSVEVMVADPAGAAAAGGQASWRPAVLTGIREVAVPFTKLAIRHCGVTLLEPLSSGLSSFEVGPSAVRLPLTVAEANAVREAHKAKTSAAAAEAPAGDSASASATGAAASSSAPPAPTYEIDENTGLGKWSSVPVEEEGVQEDGQAAAQEDGQEGAGVGAEGKTSKRPRPSEEIEDDLSRLHHDPSKALSMLAQKRARAGLTSDGMEAVGHRAGYDDHAEHAEGAMDALAAYNPHAAAGGTVGKRSIAYKGIALEDDEGQAAHASAAAAPAVKLQAKAEPAAVKAEAASASSGPGGPFPGVATLQPATASASATAASAPTAPVVVAPALARKLPTNMKIRKRDDD